MEDVEIGGKRLHANERVISFIGAANRDPDAFANPDVLDITRPKKSHLSFGRGIHYCLGAPLAILEGKSAILALLDRFPTMRLVSEPTYNDVLVLRGLSELIVDRFVAARNDMRGGVAQRTRRGWIVPLAGLKSLNRKSNQMIHRSRGCLRLWSKSLNP